MRVLTYQQCGEWCADHRFPTCDRQGCGPEPDLAEPDFCFAMFSIPADAGQRVALVKALLSLIDQEAELLVQIGDWSVWPSGQHMPLFDRLRDAFGERRPLSEAPGHVLAPGERDDAVSIVLVSALYLWDCHVLSARGDQALFVSHDEYGWFAARDAKPLGPVCKLLKKFGALAPREDGEASGDH